LALVERDNLRRATAIKRKALARFAVWPRHGIVANFPPRVLVDVLRAYHFLGTFIEQKSRIRRLFVIGKVIQNRDERVKQQHACDPKHPGVACNVGIADCADEHGDLKNENAQQNQ